MGLRRIMTPGGHFGIVFGGFLLGFLYPKKPATTILL